MKPNTPIEMDFTKLDGLVATVIQDSMSQEVLMVGFMNSEAYDCTIKTGQVHFYSRSRNRLWLKGESSGHTLQVVDLLTDCDMDALVIKVVANGPGVCHEGYTSCFFRTRNGTKWNINSNKTFLPSDVYGGAQ